jgi:hypothetical protein
MIRIGVLCLSLRGFKENVNIFTLPPLILQSLNKDLLSSPYSFLHYIKEKKENILGKANKKIRPQDTRKKREFDSLIKEFEELHGRKTIEKDQCEKEAKENHEKMSFISPAACFKRPKKL